MPRWKALPDELDPQIKEFTSQLRRLVDRGGLTIASLADRTGYSKTSWERYLGGRLLAPKGAVVALAEVTGTSPVHLTTMWELAERAWSRSEMRHDRTMEAIRISQARAALGEFGAAGATGGPGGGATAAPGIAGPAGVSPTIPPRPAVPDADARDAVPHGTDADRRGPALSGPGAAGGPPEDAGGDGGDPTGRAPGANSWNVAGYQGPSRASARPGARPEDRPDTPGPHAGHPTAPGLANRQRLLMFLAGLVGVLVIIGGVFFFTRHSGTKHPVTAKPPAPSASTDASPPPGVKCAGSACTGKDAETMGCSGDLVTTARTATVGTTTLEVRYSKACGAAWGRITGGAPGDKVQVSAGGIRQTGDITAAGDTIAYTPMIAVKNATEARACATLGERRGGHGAEHGV
ncbi:DUF2690 domain-containing protein, partial [Streptomyces sp. NPDC004561]